MEIYISFNFEKWDEVDIFDYINGTNKFDDFLPESEEKENILKNLSDEKKLEIYQKDQEIVLESFFKNYDFFSNKIFKGVVFQKKTEIKKYELGEKGIAKGYSQIKEEF